MESRGSKYGEFFFCHSELEGRRIRFQKGLNSFTSCPEMEVEKCEISNQDANPGPSGRVKVKQ